MKCTITKLLVLFSLPFLVFMPARGNPNPPPTITLIEASPNTPLQTFTPNITERQTSDSDNGLSRLESHPLNPPWDLSNRSSLAQANIPGGINKQVNTMLVAPSGILTYTITVGNNAAVPITYTITDTIPEYSAYINGSASNGLNYDPGTDSLTATAALTGTQFAFDDNQDNELHGYISLASLDVPPYQCPDIACNDNSILLNGLNFTFNGEPVKTILWHTDGFLGINNSTIITQTVNQHFPDSSEPNNVIAPLWMDFDLDGGDGEGGGHLYNARIYDGTYDYTVFEWEKAQLISDTNSSYTFQVWFREGTDELWFVYDALTGTLTTTITATVGAENFDGSEGVSYYYNGTGTPPTKGTSLKVIANADQSIFTYAVKASTELDKTIINTVELANSQTQDKRTASVYSVIGWACQLFLPLISR
ncbi:MAG: DUF11 domain-containing protein [Anaerolineales bacterium]|nr:DUF11 domain-containing protein [Anaerolineales bacterium]